MQITDEILKTILLDTQLISDKQFELAIKSAKAQGTTLYHYFVDSNTIKDTDLGQLIANHFKLPYIDLSRVAIPDNVLRIIPEDTARKRKFISFLDEKDILHVATPSPEDVEMISFLEKKINKKILVHYTTDRNIKDTLNSYAKNVTLAFEDILAENIKQIKNSFTGTSEPPIIKIVDTIIEYAFKNKASDVHLEPVDTYSLLRFRVDGLLKDIVKLPKELHDRLVTRIKVMSDLRTDVRQAPQDGKIHIKLSEETLNLRVSIVPVLGGEKVVLRVLAEKNKGLGLVELGFRDESLKRIEESYRKPYGMILTTGPTGSGKTTTLYAILKEINTREINIMTIENPVEYEIEGISQIQVNPKAGLTFATGLRSIVRQDPDVVLVGEIRDEETAKIAINAAMTGHLVLSTLHTNDAATTIPRLFDMGIEPFLVASSTNVIVGQRLVRKICEQCRVTEVHDRKNWEESTQLFPKEMIKKVFGDKNEIHTYVGKGCDICNHSGYKGRVGIYEVMYVSEEIRRAIVSKENAATIAEIAKKEGMITMFEDGLEKVKMGTTTLAEVIRGTKE